MAKYKFYLVVIALFYLLFRLPGLNLWVNYADDQGKTLLEIRSLIQNKKISLIGPRASIEKEGRVFFHGPYVYYFLMPFLILNDHPLTGSVSVIIFNLIGAWLLFATLKKYLSPIKATLLTVLFYSHPFIVDHTTFIWNPNYLLVIANAILYLLPTGRGKTWLQELLIGFLLGVGILLHYQFIAVLGLVILYYLWQKKSIIGLARIGIGLLSGLLPMIIFELRHNFYNIKTLFFIMRGYSTYYQKLPFYYFLSFVPPVYIYLAKKIKKFSINYLAVVTFIGMAFFAGSHLKKIISWEKHWNLKFAQEVASTIKQQAGDNYNLANLLTGDTRAHALRYLLVRTNNPPNGVENYPKSAQLFVISGRDKDLQAENNPWEITSFNGKVVKEWYWGQDNQFKLSFLTNDNP